MTEILNNNNSTYPSVRETIQKFNMYGKLNGSLSIPIQLKTNTHSSTSTISENKTEHNISTATINLLPYTNEKRHSISSISHINNENIESISVPMNNGPLNIIHNNSDDIGLTVIEYPKSRKQTINNDETHESLHCAPSTIDDYGENDIQQQPRDLYPPIPLRLPPPLPPGFALPNIQESNSPRKRSLPLSNFLLEIGALVVVFILCMVLVLAIREEQLNLRTTMQVFILFFFIKSFFGFF